MNNGYDDLLSNQTLPATLQAQLFHSSVYQSVSSKFTNVRKPPTTRTVVSRRLHGGGSRIIYVAFEYSGWSNVTAGTKWCLDAI